MVDERTNYLCKLYRILAIANSEMTLNYPESISFDGNMICFDICFRLTFIFHEMCAIKLPRRIELQYFT